MAKSKIVLPSLPSLPSSSSPRRLKPCFCGCGTPTASTFAPGHDSTLKAWVIRVERGVVALDGPELADFPKVREVIAKCVAERKAGRVLSFMRNVELPVAEVVVNTKVG